MFYGDLTEQLKLISDVHAAEIHSSQENGVGSLTADVTPEIIAVPYVQGETILQGAL